MVCALLVATLGILPLRQSPRSATGYLATAKSQAGRPFLTDGGSGDEFVDDLLGHADRVGVRKPEDDVRESCLDGVADNIAGDVGLVVGNRYVHRPNSRRHPFDLGSARGAQVTFAAMPSSS